METTTSLWHFHRRGSIMEPMGKKTKFLILGVLVLMIAAPFFALSAGLVPCGDKGEPPCTLCSLFDLAQSIINWLTTIIAPAIAVLAFTVGGFKILMSGPNPGLRAEGIKAIRNGAIGLLIVFGAWIIVNELLLFAVGGTGTAKVTSFAPWSEITCIPPVPPEPEPAAALMGGSLAGEKEIRDQLFAAGIGVKTNYCVDFNTPPSGQQCCTTVAQLPTNAINSLIALKNACTSSGCIVYVTGGTEQVCHASHGPGNAIVDLQLNNSLNAFIYAHAGGENNYTNIPGLGRRYTITGQPFAGSYLLEYEDPKKVLNPKPTHWHVQF